MKGVKHAVFVVEMQERGKPLEQGATHTTSRDRRTDQAVEKRIFFLSKTACTHAGHALFGRIG